MEAAQRSLVSLQGQTEGPNDYRGELDFDADGDDACRLTFTLHTEDDHPGIDASIDETLDTIARKLAEQPTTANPTGEARAAENAEREPPA